MINLQRLGEWAEKSRIGQLFRRDFLQRVLLIGGIVPLALALPKESEPRLATNASEPSANRGVVVLRCSFCNKEQSDVRKLIAGPGVFICDSCVDVCNDIIADDERFEARARV
jgi:hypothetical protein